MKQGYLALTLFQFFFNPILSVQPKVSFTENKGQISDQNYMPRPDVLFGGNSNGLLFHLRKNGISYQLLRSDNHSSTTEIYRVDINWINTNSNILISTDQVLPGFNNYYSEACPNGALHVRSYSGITYKNIYKDIDLHYYEKNGSLKYDYLVSAGANYKQIQLEIKGATQVKIADRDVIIITPFGTIIEKTPVVFQNNKPLKAKWKLEGTILSFEIENYDSSKPMIIDPEVRIWGTYYGGSGYDQAYGTTTDQSNNVYITGLTSTNPGTLIATSGSHQNTYGGNNDAYLAKFTSTGTRLWGTYYGSSAYDDARSCVTDESKNVFMCGTTQSGTATSIATLGSHQPVAGDGNDAFLVKFDSNGVRSWATYYGGIGYDQGNDCAMDAMGNIYMSGLTQTNSGTVIATSGAHQPLWAGNNDAFLVKFNGNGNRIWSTYYGGNAYDSGNACSTDSMNNVYLSGHTQSTGGIATAGSHLTTYGGNADAYLVKFDAAGTRQWGTYYGGASDDRSFGCASDKAGNTYIVGSTFTGTGTAIATPGSFQPTISVLYDGYLAKFNTSGVRQWGTYYGGNSMDNGVNCSVDAKGNVYMLGNTQSSVGISSAGSHQTIYGGGMDAFLVKFTPAGVRSWATYYGGGGYDDATTCTIDKMGGVYVCGFSDTPASGTIIATPGSFQPAYSGTSYDGYLVKFSDCSVVNINVVSSSSILCTGSSATLSASGSTTYTWSTSASTTSIIVSPTLTTTYSVTAIDENNCMNSSVFTQSVGTCTGIFESIVLSEFSIYPNPSADNFTITNSSNNTFLLVIYNGAGQLVFSQKMDDLINSVDLKNYASGIYYLKIFSGNSQKALKLIKN